MLQISSTVHCVEIGDEDHRLSIIEYMDKQMIKALNKSNVHDVSDENSPIKISVSKVDFFVDVPDFIAPFIVVTWDIEVDDMQYIENMLNIVGSFDEYVNLIYACEKYDLTAPLSSIFSLSIEIQNKLRSDICKFFSGDMGEDRGYIEYQISRINEKRFMSMISIIQKILFNLSDVESIKEQSAENVAIVERLVTDLNLQSYTPNLISIKRHLEDLKGVKLDDIDALDYAKIALH